MVEGEGQGDDADRKPSQTIKPMVFRGRGRSRRQGSLENPPQGRPGGVEGSSVQTDAESELPGLVLWLQQLWASLCLSVPTPHSGSEVGPHSL